MKSYEQYLLNKGYNVTYIDSKDKLADIRHLIPHLAKQKCESIQYYNVVDYNLEKRINNACYKNKIAFTTLESPNFINSNTEIETYFKDKKKYFQTDFYIAQRKQRNILVNNGQPFEGKWSFDTENRLKYPKAKVAPKLEQLKENQFYKEARIYIAKNFNENYGENDSSIIYPTDFKEAENWLNQFLVTRFSEFGLYEDAIVDNEHYLNHSILTPMLNVGLLLPMQIIETAINYGLSNNIAYNNIEGFVRQILGWREFIRAIYQRESVKQRTTNYWAFERNIPASFYNGTTGIKPVDDAINKLNKTAYNHHIERLMILSNFMLLCEFKPNAVYQWFMEMYIDAYDWVMVPNVYGMGQFADGGIMCTKPYISGSNYILKMSNYKKGEPWTEVWDALFWRFMNVHRSFFLKNPRLGMLIHTYDKMNEEKRNKIMTTAENYLNTLN